VLVTTTKQAHTPRGAFHNSRAVVAWLVIVVVVVVVVVRLVALYQSG
jgi:hypothetical protein